MTAKRFTVPKQYRCIQDNQTEEKYLCEDKSEAIALANLLNALHEENQELKSKYSEQCIQLDFLKDENQHMRDLVNENEQLKQINRNLQDFRNFITEKNVSNEKQRKELQLQMLRLYNYFENYFEDAMSPNAFSEMWDNVKEDKKWEKR